MKQLISFFITTLLLVSTLALTCINFGNAQSGLITFISSDTTWTKSASPYSLNGPIVVSQGVTLTIEAGTIVNFNSYYLTVNGTLRAVGSSSDKISFNGGSIEFTSFSSSWNEQAGSGCIIQNAVLNGTSVSEGSAKIDNCTINAQSINSFMISNNIIVGSVSGPNILGNIITGEVSGSGLVSKNNITGTVLALGSCVVSHNYITEGGVVCREQSQIIENTIYGCQNGVSSIATLFYSGGNPLIEKNLITNNTVGVYIDIFVRNWFGNNIPNVRNNTISHNSVGIKYQYGTQESWLPPYTNITYNNIQDNTEFNFYLGSSEIYANVTYNWWGTTDQQAINLTIRDYKYALGAAKVSLFHSCLRQTH